MFFQVKTSEELRIDPDEAEEYKWVTIPELKEINEKEGALSDFFQRYPAFDIAK